MSHETEPKLSELERACIEYDRAVALNEQDLAARCHRAEEFLQQGRVEAATEELKRILQLDPACEQAPSLRARGIALALGPMARYARAPRQAGLSPSFHPARN
jgi:Tfp pilus assembly protein PilF